MTRSNALRLSDVAFSLLAGVLVTVGALGLREVIAHPGSAKLGASSFLRVLSRPPTAAAVNCPEMTILLVGADDRRGRGRADAIMIATIRPASRRVALVSVPRDTLAEIPGRRPDKINHAYHFGGVRLLRQAVEGLIFRRVDRHAKLDFATFKEAVDLLGGVVVTVPDVEGRGRGMNYDDRADGLHIHLRPGRQRLNGEQAMGFVRYRRDGDLQRAARQREFLRALAEQHLRPAQLPGFTRAVAHVLRRMDTDLSLGEALGLARSLSQVPAEGFMLAALPVRSAPAHGVYYSEVDEVKARELRAQVDRFLTTGNSGGYGLSECTVTVLNGSGRPGAAQAARQQLRARGVRVAAVGNAQRFGYDVTEITYSPRAEDAAKELARVLQVRHARLRQRSANASVDPKSIEVVVGRDLPMEP